MVPAFECSTGWFCNKIINAEEKQNSALQILVLVHKLYVYAQETLGKSGYKNYVDVVCCRYGDVGVQAVHPGIAVEEGEDQQEEP